MDGIQLGAGKGNTLWFGGGSGFVLSFHPILTFHRSKTPPLGNKYVTIFFPNFFFLSFRPKSDLIRPSRPLSPDKGGCSSPPPKKPPNSFPAPRFPTLQPPQAPHPSSTDSPGSGEGEREREWRSGIAAPGDGKGTGLALVYSSGRLVFPHLATPWGKGRILARATVLLIQVGLANTSVGFVAVALV